MGPEPYEVVNPEWLDPAKRWFVTGLCYSYAGFPRSIIQTMCGSEKEPVPVTSLLLPDPVYVSDNFKMPINNWDRTVQGLSLAMTMRWLERLAAVSFRMGSSSWKIRVKEIPMNDPLSPLRMVTMFYLLPYRAERELSVVEVVNNVAIIKEQRNG